MLKTAFCLLALAATVVRIPGPLAPYRGSSIVTSKEKGVGWTADWGMELVQSQGKKAVRFTEKGKGHLSSFPQEVHWSLEAVWSAESAFLPLESEKTVMDPDDHPLLIERKHFDHEKGIVRLERQTMGGILESKSLEVPADTLIVEGLAGILRFVSFEKTREFSAHILSNEPRVYNVTFEWRGTERVKTPAGEFESYKLEMVPHLGVLNLIRPFLPKALFWFTASHPHDWIRYEGPESGPGTPGVVMELSDGNH